MSILKAIFGDENTKAFKKAKVILPKVNELESEMQNLSDEALKAKTTEFKKRLESGETLDDILPEAFAVVREASVRTTGMRHFDVQIIGGSVIHNGDIAEMRTGEGKTLVATLPVYLNAIEGKGVHLITVNDYLARLHAVLMGQIYDFLGLSVGVVIGDGTFLYTHTDEGTEVDNERDEKGTYKVEDELLTNVTRKEAYGADITYGTNSEFGFDYLRDNIAQHKSDVRQRDFVFAIIDEIDSILIDEARTPLIVSAPAAESDEFYRRFADIATKLHKDEDYTIDEKQRAIKISESGIEKAEKELGYGNIYTEGGIKYVHHLETAVKAKALFQRDKDYLVKDGEVIIVDEFTGRMQQGRRWSEGLHQAIEAKEDVEIQKESRTYASVTYQNYFRMYNKLAGMTGTAVTSSEEFFKVYGLNTVEIPTNVPIQRVDHNDLIFQTQQGKFKAIARKVAEIHSNGQPVLIGTASVETNELLSAYLTKEGIKHELLNAKNHEREGEIIAMAGEKGSVTIATNMAGRGVDIKLGGPEATKEQYEEVKSLGGLFVLGTERHEARRIDNQLRGRAGRQGDPGETQFYVSLEDSLMRVFASDLLKNMMGRFGIPEDEPIEQKMITRALESAQTKIEGIHFDSRKQVLAYDDILNKQRHKIYSIRNGILLGDNGQIEDEISRISDKISSEKLGSEPLLSEIASRKREEIGEEGFYNLVRVILLQTIDLLWIEHLELMDYTRQSVGLRAIGQRDPLIEYKKEALRLFAEMQNLYATQVHKMIKKIEPLPEQNPEIIHSSEQVIVSNNDSDSEERVEGAEDDNPGITNGTNVDTVKGSKHIMGDSDVNEDSIIKYDGRQVLDKSMAKITQSMHKLSHDSVNTRRYSRNEKVSITDGNEIKKIKYKKAEPLLTSGEWRIVE